MKNINTITGNLIIKDQKIAIISTRFNEYIVKGLVTGATDMLQKCGISAQNITVFNVPGAFELPLSAQKIAQSGKYQAIIALGAIIRGATPHFDVVTNECTKGLAQVSLQNNIAIAMGVLTCDTIEQAIERSGTKAGNKGAESAQTVIEMISILQQI
ncbi:MAG: 6,7-dimethyl-8-ribityllumazine synthase [Gammaproteobacteria bacterium]|nr:MAG: 6,7-dimethyl-8-ribityllumazine synthase [Gammaproteobacteria bacterium]